MSDKPKSLFSRDSIHVDPDIPEGTVIIIPGGMKQAKLLETVDRLARKMMDLEDILLDRESTREERLRDAGLFRRMAWQLLIDNKYVNAVVGIDWGAHDAKKDDERVTVIYQSQDAEEKDRGEEE